MPSLLPVCSTRLVYARHVADPELIGGREPFGGEPVESLMVERLMAELLMG